jgi:hypothetical protein
MLPVAPNDVIEAVWIEQTRGYTIIEPCLCYQNDIKRSTVQQCVQVKQLVFAFEALSVHINWAVWLTKCGELISDVQRLADLVRHRSALLRSLTATASLWTSNIIWTNISIHTDPVCINVI